MDRIDLHIEVPRLKFEKLSSNELGEKSEIIRKRVSKTRKIQSERFKRNKIITNSEMNSQLIRKYCSINETEKELLKNAINKFGLSPRGYHRLLKISRTIADMENSLEIKTKHLAEAIQYRFKEEV